MAKRVGSVVRRAWAQKGHPCNDQFREFGQRFETRQALARWHRLVDTISYPQRVDTPLADLIERFGKIYNDDIGLPEGVTHHHGPDHGPIYINMDRYDWPMPKDPA